jgi:hypothetical protein
MVSAWFVVKACVAFALCGEAVKLPALLDATAEELTAGLENGDFTSVDLVKVSLWVSLMKKLLMLRVKAYVCVYVGVWTSC